MEAEGSVVRDMSSSPYIISLIITKKVISV
jgi:hypothetical protein